MSPACLRILAFFLLTGSSLYGQDKFATSGRLNAGVGTGIGFFAFTNNQTGDPRTENLAGNLQLHADLGIMPFLTAGVAAFRNGFSAGDSADIYEKARIAGLSFYGHLNFLRRKRSTWYLKGSWGFSQFTYTNERDKTSLRSFGGIAGAGLGFRRYFGNHLGIFSEVLLSTYDYRELKDSRKAVLKTKIGNNYEVGVAGAEVKFGLTLALGSNGN